MTYKGMRRTDLITFVYGKDRRVYEDVLTGRLFYVFAGHWAGTFPEYCIKG